MSLLGLGGATLQVFFEAARPYLVAAAVASLGYSFYTVYRRPFRPKAVVQRLWITAVVAAVLILFPVIRG